jgi:acetate kinase
MRKLPPRILAVNGGSSSIRFALYELGNPSQKIVGGKIDRIGMGGANLVIDSVPGGQSEPRRIKASNHQEASLALLDALEGLPSFPSVSAVGHRVVHGMKHSRPERVTPRLLSELRRITPYDPDHLPTEIGLMEAFLKRCPMLPQVACFDTAFHRTMPAVARMMPIPRRFAAKGVERYGFHGLSCAYLMEELGRLDPRAAKGRVILAHLGNGASLTAVRRGKSIDTSMGFTPASGLVMGTRSGDLDPGLGYFLARTEGMTAAQFQKMVNHESGLRGISGGSSDLRDLLARRFRDQRSAEAVALFCYQARKWIGSFSAALDGLDTLVFSAGIGENSPFIRQRICDGLEFLGVRLDRKRNSENAALVSSGASRVKVRVIRTNEELIIARSVARMINAGSARRT